MEEYSVHNFTVKGCSGSKTIYSQYQCGNHSNKDLFTFAVSITFMLLFCFLFVCMFVDNYHPCMGVLKIPYDF